MNYLIFLVIVFLFIIILLIYNYFKISKAVTKLNYDEFKNHIRNVQLVDVREKDEFMYAHINGARNIPMSQINFKCMSLLKDKPIYLCDKNGTLSPRAALTLKKNGYSDIYMLKNGLQDWKENLKTKK